MPGIDISGFQNDDVPGGWDFICVKTSEGNSVVNPKAAKQWGAAARTDRGLYHYARPLLSDGGTQANVFCNDALARGFKPNVNFWQLDAEDGENAGVSAAQWHQFIVDFMSVCLARLGRRGFLYAGWPFITGHNLTDLVYKFMWWLPDYGNNNGVDHGFSDVPAQYQGLVIIHQYTSNQGRLDENTIINALAFHQLIVPGGNVQQQWPGGLPPFVSTLVTDKGAWGLADDGGIFTLAGPFLGSAHGQAYFAGRHGARLVKPGTVVPGAAPPAKSYPSWALYEIIDTAGERYVPVPPK